MYEKLDIEEMNLSYFCRKCKQKVRGIPLTEPQYYIGEFHDDPYIICRCSDGKCRELTFVIYNTLNDCIYQTFPVSGYNPNDYHEAIPEKIREDLSEADKCFNAGSYRGAVVMNRRALQNLIIDKIPDKSLYKMRLVDQIGELYKKGFITKHLKDTANEIRHFGNFGAHPQDDLLDDTKREDAVIIDRLTFDIIRSVYINPYETKKLKEKRIGK
jgi:hypothetical protein